MNTQPFTNSKGVISGNCWRIGVLSDSLLRLEWSDTGEFNDDATLMAVNRDFGTPPEYSTSIADGLLTVETTALRLTYDMRPFSKEGLGIVVKGVKDTKTNTWHFGDAQEGNMKGTARTLDWADGAIPLNDGVVSRDAGRFSTIRTPAYSPTMVTSSPGRTPGLTCTSSGTATVMPMRWPISAVFREGRRYSPDTPWATGGVVSTATQAKSM